MIDNLPLPEKSKHLVAKLKDRCGLTKRIKLHSFMPHLDFVLRQKLSAQLITENIDLPSGVERRRFVYVGHKTFRRVIVLSYEEE